MSKIPSSELLIGAHTSAQGGAQNAIWMGQEIGATTVQFFTSNQKRWSGKEITQEQAELFQEAVKTTGLCQLMSHDSYLINLGSSNPSVLHKSQKAFEEELIRCQKLGVSFLNFHPGSAVGATEEQCLNNIVASLEQFEELISHGATRLLLETTAGQGSTVGYCFEHLAYLIEKLHRKIPIGVCIDTCHIFAAGYDIRTKAGLEKTLKDFERIIGMKHLYAFHLNDSLKPLGSRRDRHAPLGKGEIGIECFKALMKNPKTRRLPKYLETPDGPPLWEKEIAMLREFADL
ncbi:deoxyribonuclease IV [Candidatus Rhabdochlamydia porcellionis]|jgi:deoxyribonuclease IV|uniref:Probable endonuclease 4 n=1 Tax=Candidatus Rhabdochlamydia porcellionis TaxID=225148 RepID=A0ABX8Z158_9BACT|nr:deoxyribonuclease IV [Candidatus Rhabdochlamydia porcellionis]QZA59173.1 Endonuclease 4 [Candidatus Rhabdochlamydia porcellionis]